MFTGLKSSWVNLYMDFCVYLIKVEVPEFNPQSSELVFDI